MTDHDINKMDNSMSSVEFACPQNANQSEVQKDHILKDNKKQEYILDEVCLSNEYVYNLLTEIKTEGRVTSKGLIAINEEEKRVEKKKLEHDCASMFEGYEKVHSFGQGGQGMVLKVINKRGEITALKLYDKSQEKEFLREMNTLIILRRMSYYQVDVFGTIETDKHYGIIMEAGIGSLADFKKFLVDEQIELTTNELFVMLRDLLWFKYSTLKDLSFCHRDIKPQNIIVNGNGLLLNFIDFGLAICTTCQDQILGVCGTKGYIAPEIYNNKDRKYTAKDLESNDLFALGISILEIAVTSFQPEQNNMDKIKKAIHGLEKREPIIAQIIEVLIFGEEDKYKKALELLSSSFNPDNGRNTKIYKHYNQFRDYMLNRYSDKSVDKAPLLADKKLSLEISKIFSKEMPHLVEIDAQHHASQYELKRNEIIFSLENNDKDQALERCEELFFQETVRETINQEKHLNLGRALIKLLLDNKAASKHPLTYCTLGVCSYLRNDISKAEEAFLEGLEEGKDDLSKMILLNNHGCLCSSLSDKDNLIYNTSLEASYDLMIRIVPDDLCIVQLWEQFSFSHKKRHFYEIQLTEGANQTRRDVKLLMNPNLIIYNFLLMNYSEKLFLHIFINFCCNRTTYLISILKKRNQELLVQIQQFVAEFYQQKDSVIRLKKYLQILSCILKFAKIFLDQQNQLSEPPELAILFGRANTIHKKRTYLYGICQRNDARALFEEFKHCSLFYVMIGSIFHSEIYEASIKKFTAREVIADKLSTMSEVTESVDFIIKNPSMLVNFSYADAFIEPLEDLHYSQSKSNKIILTNMSNYTLGQNDLINWAMTGEVSIGELNTQEPDFQKILNGLENPQDTFKFEAYADSFVKLKKVFPSLHALGYKISREQWEINYIELQNHLEIDLKAGLKNERQAICCLKIFGPESAVLQITSGWHHSFSLITEKMSRLPLLKLDLKFLQCGADKEEKQIQNLADILSSVKSLKCLKILISTSLLTVKGIDFLGKSIEKLEQLNILHLIFQYCPNIADNEMKRLAELVGNIPKLKHFTLEFLACSNVTREQVKKVMTNGQIILPSIEIIGP